MTHKGATPPMERAAKIGHKFSLLADNAGYWTQQQFLSISEVSQGYHPASLSAASQKGMVGSDANVPDPPQVPIYLQEDQGLGELVNHWLFPRLPGRRVTSTSLWHGVLQLREYVALTRV